LKTDYSLFSITGASEMSVTKKVAWECLFPSPIFQAMVLRTRSILFSW